MNRQEKYLKKTGDIYGSLFTEYSDNLFEESIELIIKRHKMWGIDLDWFKDKKCLDAGCGGGRFCVALSRWGAEKVRGIDISKNAVKEANIRFKKRNLDQAKAIEASVLEIPFDNNEFDYVVSNGVIHHTPDPVKAFGELVRVLKPGGKIFLSVYGTGGLKWFTNDVFRYTLCKVVNFKTLESIFKFFKVPANKRYNILDNLYVNYCYRYKESEIREWLETAGFENLRRVKFERYDYSTLMSRIIHGEGWIQFYADKK